MIESHKIFFQNCEFVAGATSIEIIPPFSMPEVAFAGRSNVGKSSLINALVNRNSLAKVSNTPGRTQQINFFDLANRMFLVDLPGYGYAAISKKTRKQWDSLILDYLRGRPTLARVFLLIDSRHGLKQTDEQIMKILDSSAVVYQIVLTKCDQVSGPSLSETVNKISEQSKKHPAAFPNILTTSSKKHNGIDTLRDSIVEILENHK